MENTNRRLRSQGPTTDIPPVSSKSIASPLNFAVPSSSSDDLGIEIVDPGSKLSGLEAAELNLLRRKQRRLKETATSTLNSLPPRPCLTNGLQSSLIFAQDVAGTAICISPTGWLLTCSHCVFEWEDEYQAATPAGKRRWLLFYTGLAVQAECRAWDEHRDLALLQIIAVESADTGDPGHMPVFHYVQLSPSMPSLNTPIICIGQPGADDLESAKARKTKYHLVEISEGTFQGMVHNADPQDCSEMGTLMHDAWTYWGHSGAPLLKETDGTLLGLHSSWDDRTTMRHGIPVIAIQNFLQQHLPPAFDPGPSSLAATSEEKQATNAGPANGAAHAKGPKKAKRQHAKERPAVIVIDDED